LTKTKTHFSLDLVVPDYVQFLLPQIVGQGDAACQD